MINDVLTLARIEAGKVELDEQVVTLGEVIGASIRALSAEAAAKSVTIIDEGGSDAPIRLDPNRMKQVFVHLLSNAVKFNREGGTVRVSAALDRPDTLTVCVSDTGCGIPPDHLNRVFEPFSQVEDHLTRENEGVGLGLPLARAMVPHARWRPGAHQPGRHRYDRRSFTSRPTPQPEQPWMTAMTHFVIPMAEKAEPIGRVIAVSAAQLVVLLQPPTFGAPPRAPLEMAALVKIRTRASVVFGMVSGLRVPLPSVAAPDDDLKIVEIELIGETSFSPSGRTDGFRRGVSVFPALEDPVFVATPDDLAQVYAPPREAAVPVGSIHQDADVPAFLLVDDLLGKHFSIVGTTGSGKSCAVATILRSVIEKNPHAHVILLDPHCEYAPRLPRRGDRAEPRRRAAPALLAVQFRRAGRNCAGRGRAIAPNNGRSSAKPC